MAVAAGNLRWPVSRNRLALHYSSNTLVVSDPPTELDAATVPELDELLKSAVLDWGRPVLSGGIIVVDLSDVTFTDSTAVGCLLKWRAQAQEVGLDLRVRNPRPIVAKVLNILGVTDRLLYRRPDPALS